MLSIDYIAGFVDGEGCITLAAPSTKTDCYIPKILITNTNFEILRALAYTLELWNIEFKLSATAHKNRKRKICYILVIQKQESVYSFCNELRTRLKVKQRQAEILVEYITLRHIEGKYGKCHLLRRNELFAEMKMLNKKGIK